MTNIFGRPEKHERKKRLFEIGVQTLEARGYVVEREPGIRKSSVRRITKDGESQMVAIRTTQDQWMAFPENDSGGWGTLEDVDLVVVVSVDSWETPRLGLVHLFDQADITARFDRARQARLDAGRVNPASHGLYVSLYDEETGADPYLVGAGAGRASPPIARVPLDPPSAPLPPLSQGPVSEEAPVAPAEMIAEFRRSLALILGVDPSAIKISVDA